MASGSWIGNGRTSVVCVFTRDDESPQRLREFTSLRVLDRFRVLDRLSESGFAGFTGDSQDGECLLDREWCSREYERCLRCSVQDGEMATGSGVYAREFTSVYERWTDCLNQDLPDFWGFSGWRVPPGSGMVVRALYACSREMTRVHERLREFASVSLRSLMFQVTTGASISDSSPRARAHQEMPGSRFEHCTRVHERLREFTRVHERFGMKAFSRT